MCVCVCVNFSKTKLTGEDLFKMEESVQQKDTVKLMKEVGVVIYCSFACPCNELSHFNSSEFLMNICIVFLYCTCSVH